VTKYIGKMFICTILLNTLWNKFVFKGYIVQNGKFMGMIKLFNTSRKRFEEKR